LPRKDQKKAVIRKSSRKSGGQRELKAEEIRRALIEAGARVVGRYGYNGASISRITARAKVALGTFYRHFSSRQELLDELLPTMGERLLTFVQEHVDREAVGPEREEQRLRAYLKFLMEHPWYHRLLNEGEVLAPKGYKAYFERVSSGLVRSLQRSVERSEIKRYDPAELETVAYILLASRVYLAQRYAYSNGSVKEPPEEIMKTYSKFVRRALFDTEMESPARTDLQADSGKPRPTETSS
jgi:AcrR family transcriptional regulator